MRCIRCKETQKNPKGLTREEQLCGKCQTILKKKIACQLLYKLGQPNLLSIDGITEVFK